MKHWFDVDIAKKLGINSAILLENLYFWVKKNEANKKHYHDGRYWTYNSVEAFTKLFPYFTYDSIRYALSKLEKDGYIVTGNYNTMPMDKTKWYALTEKTYSLLENSQMDLGFFPDGISNTTKAIPDNKPDNKKNVRKNDPEETFEDIINSLVENQEIRNVLVEFIKMRKLIKKPLTNRALKNIISKLKKLAGEDAVLAMAILDQSITNGWQDIYQLKEDYGSKQNKKRKSTAISKPYNGETVKDEQGNDIVF